MVWLKQIIILFSLLFSVSIFCEELTDDEQMYFNFIDFNNDNKIAQSEIDQSIKIIFQLIDLNKDGFISKFEVNELKNITNALK